MKKVILSSSQNTRKEAEARRKIQNVSAGHSEETQFWANSSPDSTVNEASIRIGAMGEIVVLDEFTGSGAVLENGSPSHDLRIGSLLCEVKTLGVSAGVAPTDAFKVLVADEDRKHHPDVYIFVFVQRESIPGGGFTQAWIAGWMPYGEYWEQSTGAKENSETWARTDCHWVRCDKLRPCKELPDYAKELEGSTCSATPR